MILYSADLGVSSMQIDNPESGDLPISLKDLLDLRLNPREGISAAERLADITQPELEGMLTLRMQMSPLCPADRPGGDTGTAERKEDSDYHIGYSR